MILLQLNNFLKSKFTIWFIFIKYDIKTCAYVLIYFVIFMKYDKYRLLHGIFPRVHTFTQEYH